MRARYPVTQKLRDEFKYLRTELLKYSHESFGEIFKNAGSWSYNFEKGKKSATISFELLRTFFIAQYNVELFYKKLDKMQELLSQAIENKTIKEKTTLLKIYGSVDPQKPTQIIPPKEIFLGKSITFSSENVVHIDNQCMIEQEFYVRYSPETINIFSEKIFPKELRYLPMLYNQGDEKKLSVEQNERLENYIFKKVSQIIKNGSEIQEDGLPKEDLSNEYWLYALYLTYGKTKFSPTMWEYIKKAYFPSADKEYAWRYIFSLLEDNEFLKSKNKHDDSNVIYFRNTKEPISKNNLPVFYVKYSFNDMEKTDDNETDFYDIRRGDAVTGKLSYMDIISLIFRYQMSLGKNEDEAFKETLLKMYEEGIATPFNEFNLIEYPENEKTLNINAHNLIMHISDFFDKNDSHIEEDFLLRFLENCLALGPMLFDVINVDFKFIQRINHKYVKDLNSEFKKSTREFRKKHLLD